MGKWAFAIGSFVFAWGANDIENVVMRAASVICAVLCVGFANILGALEKRPARACDNEVEKCTRESA